MEVFGPKKDEVIWECRILHNEELNDLYCSPYIIQMIRTRKNWTRHVTRTDRTEVHTGFGRKT